MTTYVCYTVYGDVPRTFRIDPSHWYFICCSYSICTATCLNLASQMYLVSNYIHITATLLFFWHSTNESLTLGLLWFIMSNKTLFRVFTFQVDFSIVLKCPASPFLSGGLNYTLSNCWQALPTASNALSNLPQPNSNSTVIDFEWENHFFYRSLHSNNQCINVVNHYILSILFPLLSLWCVPMIRCRRCIYSLVYCAISRC